MKKAKAIEARYTIQGQTYTTKKGYPARVMTKARTDGKVVVEVTYPDVGKRQVLIPPEYPLTPIKEGGKTMKKAKATAKAKASKAKAQPKKAPVQFFQTKKAVKVGDVEIRLWAKTIFADLLKRADNSKVTIDLSTEKLTTPRGTPITGEGYKANFEKLIKTKMIKVLKRDGDKVQVELVTQKVEG